MMRLSDPLGQASSQASPPIAGFCCTIKALSCCYVRASR